MKLSHVFEPLPYRKKSTSFNLNLLALPVIAMLIGAFGVPAESGQDPVKDANPRGVHSAKPTVSVVNAVQPATPDSPAKRSKGSLSRLAE